MIPSQSQSCLGTSPHKNHTGQCCNAAYFPAICKRKGGNWRVLLVCYHTQGCHALLCSVVCVFWARVIASRLSHFVFSFRFVEYALVPRVFRIENNGEILREKWRSSQVSHSRFESGRFSEIENNVEILRFLTLGSKAEDSHKLLRTMEKFSGSSKLARSPSERERTR